VTAVLLDTHSLYWWSTKSSELSARAVETIERADDLAVASVSWFELAWLMNRGRLGASVPIQPWLTELAMGVFSMPLTPTIAASAALLPSSFPGDPIDRIIYATAVEHGWPLITRDERMRRHGDIEGVTVW
jgi:PIN domain nuclease of toxin-antitoxin system